MNHKNHVEEVFKGENLPAEKYNKRNFRNVYMRGGKSISQNVDLLTNCVTP